MDLMVEVSPRRVFANAHTYHVNSISVNSDYETYMSADDLRINLWHLDITDRSFSILLGSRCACCARGGEHMQTCRCIKAGADSLKWKNNKSWLHLNIDAYARSVINPCPHTCAHFANPTLLYKEMWKKNSDGGGGILFLRSENVA